MTASTFSPAIRYDVLQEYAANHRLNYNQLCSVVRAALAETAEPVKGWKLVPVEPTLDMLKAALDADPPVSMPHWTDVFRARWSAMLNTTPQPPAPAEPVEKPFGWLPKWAHDRLTGALGAKADSITWGLHAPIYAKQTSDTVPLYAAPQPPAPAVELPALPKPQTLITSADVGCRAYTDWQMREYARAAIAAHEAKKGQQ